MKFKLGKMETPKLYYVMCRFCDGDTKDNDIFINCYLKKESAFKLRNLLNEINEYDADYFVKFEDKEIKTKETKMKNFTFTFKDTELGIDSVIFRKKYNKKSCEYDYIESKITAIKITKDRLWITINKIDDNDRYLVFDLNDETGFAKDVLYVKVPEDKIK